MNYSQVPDKWNSPGGLFWEVAPVLSAFNEQIT